MRRRLVSIALAALAAYGLGITIFSALIQGHLGDLPLLLLSGRLAEEGANPYLPDPSVQPSLSAPLSVLVYHGLAWTTPETVRLPWLVTSTLLYAGAVALLNRYGPTRPDRLQIEWAFALPPFWYGLIWGQVYALMALVVTATWLLLERRQVLTPALLLGFLIAIKPNLLVWPALLFVAGYRKVGLAIAAASGAFAALPALAYGPGVYPQWLAVVGGMDEVYSDYWNNISLWGALSRLDLEAAALPGAAALLLGAAYWAWRRRPSVSEVGNVALACSLLAAPGVWVGYLVILLPVFLCRSWTPGLTGAALLLSVPIASYWLEPLPLHPLYILTFGPLHAMAVGLVIGSATRRPPPSGALALTDDAERSILPCQADQEHRSSSIHPTAAM